jgi:ribosomal protein S18 acetylase RimI-like enzyme
MPKSWFMPQIKLLHPDEWRTLQTIRLSALRESPRSFLSTYEREKDYGEERWRAEFDRGDWSIGIIRGTPASLLGTTREPGMPSHECYLEYLWVSPEHRRLGVALKMVTTVIERLRAYGVRTAFLWVLDGNEIAMKLYKQVGFVSSNHRELLEAHPGRSEERLQLNLG